MFPYPTFADATAEYPIVLKLLRREPLDEPTKDVAHAVFVVAGVGLSVYPGAPETFGAAAAPVAYGELEAASDIEAAFGGEKFGAAEAALPAIPWNLILPILFQLLQDWLFKRK